MEKGIRCGKRLISKYNSVTVNGVACFTDNENRSTDLSMISQYMLDGIEVTKAGTPDLDSDVRRNGKLFIKKGKTWFSL